MDWFLYDRDLRHERANMPAFDSTWAVSTLISLWNFNPLTTDVLMYEQVNYFVRQANWLISTGWYHCSLKVVFMKIGRKNALGDTGRLQR